jgi:hypothetical protein
MVFTITYVIQFVSDLRQVGGFPLGIPVSSTNQTDRHDITEIFLKVRMNTLTLSQAIVLISFFIVVDSGSHFKNLS